MGASRLADRSAYVDTLGGDLTATLNYLDAVLQRYADLREPAGNDEIASEHRARFWKLCAEIDLTTGDTQRFAAKEAIRTFEVLDELRGDMRRAEKTIA